MMEVVIKTGASSPAPMLFLVAVGLPIAGMILQLAVGFLTPGRKGKIRTEKTVFHAGVSAAQAWETYAQRLLFEGFKFEPGGNPSVMSARRRSAADAFSPLEIKSFAKMPLKAEVDFEPRPDGVAVKLALWTPNSVYVDTGEGKFIDAMAERLMNADLERDPLPVVVNLSGNAHSALYTGILMLLAPALFILPGMDGARSLGVTGGVVVACVTNVIIGGLGLRDVIMKPKEMRGKWQAIVGILLSIAAVILTVALFVLTQLGSLAAGGM